MTSSLVDVAEYTLARCGPMTPQQLGNLLRCPEPTAWVALLDADSGLPRGAGRVAARRHRPGCCPRRLDPGFEQVIGAALAAAEAASAELAQLRSRL